ncbi:hypothetical protein BDZ91DRAFT_772291 [Kalaharituber pfeilii]|nr:hypothetical protein BDZ91DRAFT_772291 [Kalaharituber pfeilii]
MAPENMTLTTNAMPAHVSTLIPTLDLFNDLQKTASPAQIHDLLTQAWQFDPLETLKVIFHCRSIHLGKGERELFYKCMGWLSKSAGKTGKATVLANLQWVVDRTITKPKKKEDAEKKPEAVQEQEKKEQEEEVDENDPIYSHGYWKDLLNMVLLEVSGSFDIFADPNRILSGIRNRTPGERKPKPTTEEKKVLAKAQRHAKEKERHESFLQKFNETFYKLLHLATARAFAAQLDADLKLLESEDKEKMRKISLAAKWAPSLEKIHDKHTFICSSIAEYLFPPEHKLVADYASDRETYLKYAREHYRRLYLSPLRKHLNIVERAVSGKAFNNINYGHIPSQAMARYKKLFCKHDFEGFRKFLSKVTLGKAKISGAVMSPAVLVHEAVNLSQFRSNYDPKDAETQMNRQVLNGQWESLVRSVKERGTLENAIAVVDVSGSMNHPKFPDQTCPMDAAIGLGMLLSETAEEPFKGLMITFSETPHVVHIDGDGTPRDLYEKVKYVRSLPWGMNTNFLAVFEDLLLPLALKHKLTQEQMVKKVFVFSDMQFDQAQSYYPSTKNRWETGYERIKRKYEEHGYEVPEMVYWNLASTGARGKPVTGEKEGCVMMAGGGAGTLKAFLEAGLGKDEEEEEEEETKEEQDENEEMVILGEDGEEMKGEKRKSGEDAGEEGKKKKKKKVDPVTAMRRVLNNPAYEVLKVVG